MRYKLEFFVIFRFIDAKAVSHMILKSLVTKVHMIWKCVSSSLSDSGCFGVHWKIAVLIDG